MAVPGRATDECSRGTNALIFNRKAQPVMSARDILHELMWDVRPESVREKTEADLSDEARGLLRLFDSDPVTMDVLQLRSGLALGELSALLMDMEFDGAVRRVSGNRYEKTI